MSTPRFLAVLAAVFSTFVAARPLRAQAAADTAELAREIAAVLQDSLVSRMGTGPIVWEASASPLNASVAGVLRTHHAFRGPVRDRAHTFWIDIHGVTGDADKAYVTVEFGQDYGGSGVLTFFIEQREYLFVRTDTGWRFARSRRLRHLDGGSVRG